MRRAKYGGLSRGQSPTYYYLIRLADNSVVARCETPETLGFQFRLLVNVDKPDLIMRKSKVVMNPETTYIKTLFQELTADEALTTGVPIDDWAMQVRR